MTNGCWRTGILWAACLTGLLMSASSGPLFTIAEDRKDAPSESAALTEMESKHLANARQLTFGLPRAGEGYYSPDGQWIVYQAYPIGYPFYQIYLQRRDDKLPMRLSTGRGRTTAPDRDSRLSQL